MLDYRKAMEIATNRIKGSDIGECPIGAVLDIGDRWAVMFDLEAMWPDGVIPPGLCGTFGVDKETGKFDYITIPPLENIELLDTGKVVYKKSHFFEPEEK